MRVRFLPFVALAAVIAAARPAAAEDRLAVIDVQQILEQSSAGRIARDLLEQSTKKAKSQIDGLREQLNGMQQRYEQQRNVLKPEALAELEQQLVEKQMELRQILQQSQMDLQSRDAELTNAILEDLKPIIAELAKERQFTLVMEKGEAGVLFAAERLDLTDIVLQRYDESKAKKPATK